ncbi:hypothetical protein LSTR_LSTR005404 [Laodelphax striatellus]|uniref:Dynein regulatory complex protein 9 n=1 Tax=Laodelphax striatellus TaxID=195883 RepID=A0A482WWL3_LAOST|nr:hypothetical protein LSTR_LSTR005404 [Laodelphax striatellus]
MTALLELTGYLDSAKSRRQEPEYNLSKGSFRRDVISCVLKEAVDHLRILGSTMPFNSFDWSLVQQSNSQKLNVYIGDCGQRYPKYHEYEMNHLWKIQKDRYLLEKVLKETRNESERDENLTAKCLNETLSDFEGLEYVRYCLESKRNELRLTASELQADIRSLCLKNKEMETVEDDITFEDELILDETIECKAKERYVQRWEEARIFQNRLRLKYKEDSMKNAIGRQLKYSDMISRANEAMNTFRMNEASRLKNDCETWTKRYNKEIEELELELLKINNERESIENDLKAMAVKFQEESDGIEEFKAFLKKIEDEKQSRIERDNAVARIQRWWLAYKNLKNQLYQPKNHKSKKDKKKKKQPVDTNTQN